MVLSNSYSVRPEANRLKNHPTQALQVPTDVIGAGRKPLVRFGDGQPEKRTAFYRPNPAAGIAVGATPKQPFIPVQHRRIKL